MKKILILSNMYPSKKYPHYGVFVQNSAAILRNGGYKVSVCSIPKCDNTVGLTRNASFLEPLVDTIVCMRTLSRIQRFQPAF
jgi:hypothetical protein